MASTSGILEKCCVYVWERVDGDARVYTAIIAKIKALGAKVAPRISKGTTHVIFGRKLHAKVEERKVEDTDLRLIYSKLRQIEPSAYVVSPLWLHYSEDAGVKAKEAKYLEKEPPAPIFLEPSPSKQGAKRKRKSIAARPRELVDGIDVDDAIFSSSQQIRELNGHAYRSGPQFGDREGVNDDAPPVNEGKSESAKAPPLAVHVARGASKRPAVEAGGRPEASFPAPAPRAQQRAMRQLPLTFAVIPKKPQQQAEGGEQAAAPLPPCRSTDLQPSKEAPAAVPPPGDKTVKAVRFGDVSEAGASSPGPVQAATDQNLAAGVRKGLVVDCSRPAAPDAQSAAPHLGPSLEVSEQQKQPQKQPAKQVAGGRAAPQPAAAAADGEGAGARPAVTAAYGPASASQRRRRGSVVDLTMDTTVEKPSRPPQPQPSPLPLPGQRPSDKVQAGGPELRAAPQHAAALLPRYPALPCTAVRPGGSAAASRLQTDIGGAARAVGEAFATEHTSAEHSNGAAPRAAAPVPLPAAAKPVLGRLALPTLPPKAPAPEKPAAISNDRPTGSDAPTPPFGGSAGPCGGSLVPCETVGTSAVAAAAGAPATAGPGTTGKPPRSARRSSHCCSGTPLGSVLKKNMGLMTPGGTPHGLTPAPIVMPRLKSAGSLSITPEGGGSQQQPGPVPEDAAAAAVTSVSAPGAPTIVAGIIAVRRSARMLGQLPPTPPPGPAGATTPHLSQGLLAPGAAPAGAQAREESATPHLARNAPLAAVVPVVKAAGQGAAEPGPDGGAARTAAPEARPNPTSTWAEVAKRAPNSAAPPASSAGRGSARKARQVEALLLSPVAPPKLRSSATPVAALVPQQEEPPITSGAEAEQSDAAQGLLPVSPTVPGPSITPGSALRRSARLTSSSPLVLAPVRPMGLTAPAGDLHPLGGREKNPGAAQSPDNKPEWQGFKAPLPPASSGMEAQAQLSIPPQKKQRTDGGRPEILAAEVPGESAFGVRQEQQGKGAIGQTPATTRKSRKGRHVERDAGLKQEGPELPETELQQAPLGAVAILPSPARCTRSQARAAATPTAIVAAAPMPGMLHAAGRLLAGQVELGAGVGQMPVGGERCLPSVEQPCPADRDACGQGGQGADSWGGFRPPLPPKPIAAPQLQRPLQPQRQQQSPATGAKRRIQGGDFRSEEAAAELCEGTLGRTPGTTRKGWCAQAADKAPGPPGAELVGTMPCEGRRGMAPILPSPALHTRARSRAAASPPVPAAQGQQEVQLHSHQQPQNQAAPGPGAGDHASVRPARHETTPGPAEHGEAAVCVTETPLTITRYMTRSQRKAHRPESAATGDDLRQPGDRTGTGAAAQVPRGSGRAGKSSHRDVSEPADGAASGDKTAEEQARQLWGCVLPGARSERAGDAARRKRGHRADPSSMAAMEGDAGASSPRQQPGNVTRSRRRALETELDNEATASGNAAVTGVQAPGRRSHAAAVDGAEAVGAISKPSMAADRPEPGAPKAPTALPSSRRDVSPAGAGVSAAVDVDMPRTTAARALPTALATVAEEEPGVVVPSSDAGTSSPPPGPRVLTRGTRSSVKKLAAATGPTDAVPAFRGGRRTSASSGRRQPPSAEPGSTVVGRVAAGKAAGDKGSGDADAATHASAPARDSDVNTGTSSALATAERSATQAPSTAEAEAAGRQATGKPPGAARPGSGVLHWSRLRTKRMAGVHSAAPGSATPPPLAQPSHKRPVGVLEEKGLAVEKPSTAIGEAGPSDVAAAAGDMSAPAEELHASSAKRQRTNPGAAAGGSVAVITGTEGDAFTTAVGRPVGTDDQVSGKPTAAMEEAEAATAKPTADDAAADAKAPATAKARQPAAVPAQAAKATEGPRLGPSSGTVGLAGAKQHRSSKLLSTSSLADLRSVSSSGVLASGSTTQGPQQRPTAAAAAPALGQYPRGKEHPNRAGVRYLAHTSVGSTVEAAIQTATRQLGNARVYTPGYEGNLITHLVLGDPERRTMKVLLSIAYGAIFVTPAWVTDSLAAGQWLPEEHYVPPKCKYAATAGTVRLHLQQQQRAAAAPGSAATSAVTKAAPCTGALVAKPLAGHQVAVHSSQCNGLRLADMQKRKTDVEKLVVALGGRVVPIRSATLLIVVGTNSGATSEVRRSRAGSACGPRLPSGSDEWLMRLAETHVWQEPTQAS